MIKHLIGSITLCFLILPLNAKDYPADKIDLVLKKAHSYLGTKYVWGGNGYSGIDCSGLTKNSFQAAGINIPRNSRAQAAFWKGKIVKLRHLQKGDLVFFSGGGYRIGHVGIVTQVKNGRIRFIHSSSDNRGVKYNELKGYWHQKYVMAKRLFEQLDARQKEEKEATEGREGKKEEDKDNELTYEFEGELSEISKKYFTYKDIKGLSPCERKLIKNEVYARYGYKFHKNPVIVDYFNSQIWYRNIPKITNNSAYIYARYLSPIEKANVGLLAKYEGGCYDLVSY